MPDQLQLTCPLPSADDPVISKCANRLIVDDLTVKIVLDETDKARMTRWYYSNDLIGNSGLS